MERSTEIRPRKTMPKGKPEEIDRWEGEGGHPPPRKDRTPEITGILRKLLINWRRANPPHNK